MQYPAQRYKQSLKAFPECLEPIEYPFASEIRKVGHCGTISFKSKSYFVGEHLSQGHVGLVEKEEGIFDIYFAKTKIQRLNLKK